MCLATRRVAGIERAPEKHQVGPGVALGAGGAEQVGGVQHGQRGHRRRQSGNGDIQPFAAHPADAGGVAGDRLGGQRPQQHQAPGPHQGDVAEQERQADQHLAVGRVAVAGGAPGNQVGDQELRPVEPDARQHAVEQLAGRADERLAGPVFLGAGAFADQHQAGSRVAVGEHQVGRRGGERAAVEAGEGGAQVVERPGRLGHRAGAEDGRGGPA